MFAVIDLRLLQDSLNKPDFLRPQNQIWMLYMLECPLHTGMMWDKKSCHKNIILCNLNISVVWNNFKVWKAAGQKIITLSTCASLKANVSVQVVYSSQTSSIGQQPTGRTPPLWLHTRSGSTMTRLWRPGPSRLTTQPAKPRKWQYLSPIVEPGILQSLEIITETEIPAGMEDCNTPESWANISRLISMVPVVTTPVQELPSDYYLRSSTQLFFIFRKHLRTLFYYSFLKVFTPSFPFSL